MSALRVGMRVKKVRGDQNVGLTGIVVGLGWHTVGADGKRLSRPMDMQVQYDTEWENTKGQRRARSWVCSTDADKFEPLTPPKSHEVVDWSEMPCDRNGRYIPREVHA